MNQTLFEKRQLFHTNIRKNEREKKFKKLRKLIREQSEKNEINEIQQKFNYLFSILEPFEGKEEEFWNI